MKQFAAIGFLIVGAATIVEYLLISGLFTGPLMMGLTLLFGVLNMFLSAKNRHYNELALYLIATVGLCMGYWRLMA